MENNHVEHKEERNSLHQMMQDTIDQIHQPNQENLTIATGGGVKMDPVAFLVIRDGVTRLLPVTMPPATTVDRIVEMVPDLIDKAEKYFDKKKEKDF